MLGNWLIWVIKLILRPSIEFIHPSMVFLLAVFLVTSRAPWKLFDDDLNWGVGKLMWQWKIPIFNWKNSLGGGFKHFLFSPRKLGKTNPIWRAYFSDGLKPPISTSSKGLFSNQPSCVSGIPHPLPTGFHVGNPTRFPKAIPARYEEWFNFSTS